MNLKTFTQNGQVCPVWWSSLSILTYKVLHQVMVTFKSPFTWSTALYQKSFNSILYFSWITYRYVVYMVDDMHDLCLYYNLNVLFKLNMQSSLCCPHLICISGLDERSRISPTSCTYIRIIYQNMHKLMSNYHIIISIISS